MVPRAVADSVRYAARRAELATGQAETPILDQSLSISLGAASSSITAHLDRQDHIVAAARPAPAQAAISDRRCRSPATHGGCRARIGACFRTTSANGTLATYRLLRLELDQSGRLPRAGPDPRRLMRADGYQR